MAISPQYLLLQIRNSDDPIRRQELNCFLRRLNCEPGQLKTHDLLRGPPSAVTWQRADVVLIGGSGHYSAIGQADWLLQTLDLLRALHDRAHPVFASCWGFQAMARAMGGRLQKDSHRAELGTLPVRLTTEGTQDPLFGALGEEFPAHMGHEDSVVRLPDGAVPLAYSDRAEYQAFCFPGRPIYCTQFHPELDRTSFMERVEAYPEYIQRIAGIPLNIFAERCVETLAANDLLLRFVQQIIQPW